MQLVSEHLPLISKVYDSFGIKVYLIRDVPKTLLDSWKEACSRKEIEPKESNSSEERELLWWRNGSMALLLFSEVNELVLFCGPSSTWKS